MVAQLNRSIITGQQPDGDYVNARADGSGFSVVSSLPAGNTVTSEWVDTDGFNGIDLFIKSNKLSAANGIEVQYTDDVQATSPTVLASEFYSYTQADVDRGFLELPIKPRLSKISGTKSRKMEMPISCQFRFPPPNARLSK